MIDYTVLLITVIIELGLVMTLLKFSIVRTVQVPEKQKICLQPVKIREEDTPEFIEQATASIRKKAVPDFQYGDIHVYEMIGE